MRNVFEVADPAGLKPATEADLVVRKAHMADIHAVIDLINQYAAQGIMLPRTEFEMSENIRDFTVVYAGDRLVACGALHFYSPTSGEIRSLAVRADAKRSGLGRLVVEALEREARIFGLDSIFAFTYVVGFFGRVGFQEVERGELPLKAWKDCLRCPKFQNCDEIAVVKYLTENAARPPKTSFQLEEHVPFPILRSGAA